MNQNLVRVAIIQDNSELMKDLVQSVVDGFNELVGELRGEPGDVHLKLVGFNSTDYDVVYDSPLYHIPHITSDAFKPQGRIALIDAQTRTIHELGKELANTPDHARPGKVILATISDGTDNASKDHTMQELAELTHKQQAMYKWTLGFCGANQDAFSVADSIGIHSDSVLNYAASPNGIRSVYLTLAKQINAVRNSVRSGQGHQAYLWFSPDDRRRAMIMDPALIEQQQLKQQKASTR